MICVRGGLSISSITHRSIRESTGKNCQGCVCARLSAAHCVCKYTFCVYFWLCISLFSSMHAVSLLPPASVSERDLRIGPGPQGSCLDWISNQCYTSCVLASAIFNTQGETLPGEKGELSACVGSSMGDIIIRTLGRRLDLKIDVSALILKLLETHEVGESVGLIRRLSMILWSALCCMKDSVCAGLEV